MSVTSAGPESGDQSDFRIITLETAERRQQAAELYRSVFGYQHPAYGVNPRLLAGIATNGGSVIGVLDGNDRLVGFAYGFLGTDGDVTYHYSQAAVVAPGLQSKGLGRRLKLAQREIALGWGSTAMRWAYDPMLTRNAHFNLDVLGARGVRFCPNMYGEPGTDRIVIEWDLTRDPSRRNPPEELPPTDDQAWGELIKDADRAFLAVPSDISALRTADSDRAKVLTGAVRRVLTGLFDDGYQATSCSAAGPTAWYVFRSVDHLRRGRI
jgi:predicted GNAT superfamily acetyltransferase